MRTVAVLVGSLREKSVNRTLATLLGRLATDRLEFRPVALGDLPIYNDDLWSDPPAQVLRLKQEVEATDAVLFVTPEYNRSYSPVISNAIDWGSRPRGTSVWAGKPAGIIGTSPGAIGTAVAQATLRSVAVACGMVVMGHPEFYLTWKPELYDSDGNTSDEKTLTFLNGWIDRFTAWIERVHK